MSAKKSLVGTFGKTLLVAMVLLLTACAGLAPKPDSVKVNLSNLRMLESTLFEQRFEVTIRVQNRSQSALKINGLSFDLLLNEKDFASGVSNQSMTIEPLSEDMVTVNLTSTLFNIIRQVDSMQKLQSEPFRYDLRGTFYMDNSLFGLSFSEKGEINLAMPKAQKSL